MSSHYHGYGITYNKVRHFYQIRVSLFRSPSLFEQPLFVKARTIVIYPEIT